MSVLEFELEEDLYAELLELASVEGTTVDELVRDIIIEALDSRADINLDSDYDEDEADDDDYGELDF